MQTIGRSAVDLADAVRNGRVTAVEVVRAHLDHIDAHDERLGAFVVVRHVEALREAAEVDARSDRGDLPLAGVPVAIKDVADVTGLPTRHGSLGTSTELATSDDETVARLRAAGAVVVGKTRCPELSVWGISEDAHGVARNPWNLDRTPGGSSGGSGAAVAAGMVPIALGSDGMGSVRIPAACNGLVGIKPGSGVVPMSFGGGDEHWSGMTQYGPLATTVADLALMLDVLAGRRPGPAPHEPDERLRIGVATGPVLLGTKVSRPWKKGATRLGKLLAEAGHEVVSTKVPATTADVLATTARWLHGCEDDLNALGVDRDAIEKRTRGQARAGRLLTKAFAIRPEQAERWKAKVAEMFEDLDVLLAPSLLRTPPSASGWRDKGWVANLVVNANYASLTGPWNFADVPAAAVPIGRDNKDMPRSVQVIGPHGAEARVLSVLAQVEQLAPWRRHAPGMIPTA